VSALRGLLTNLSVSRYYETVPVGVSGPQAMFLNAAAVADTALTARGMLDALLAIEQERGRERPYARSPRTLDLDLILLGDVVLEEPGLVVPHPRFRERRFVLEPLAAVAPELRDPVSGDTVSALLSRLSAS
jgi:2-amino-4-hydroxy-6-hydroxymethyldihydropteridine diphosphokinase